MELLGVWLLMGLVLACMGDVFAITALIVVVGGAAMIVLPFWLGGKFGVVGLIIGFIIVVLITAWCDSNNSNNKKK